MYNETSEEIVELLIARTMTDDPHFFRTLTAFYFGMLASMMRTSVVTYDRGEIPVNCYALCLGPSGLGKNFAVNTIEEVMITPFKENFITGVGPSQARISLSKLAVDVARRTGDDPDEVREKLMEEYEDSGEFVFTYDSATSAALRQLRRKLLLSSVGSLNLVIDEIGSNLSGSEEVLTDYLSLYDKGLLKQKIIKNTKESQRGFDLDGPTPSNLLMFGTPSKLLDGSTTEKDFIELEETGYARRLLTAYSPTVNKIDNLSPEEVFERACATNASDTIRQLQTKFAQLADDLNFGTQIYVPRDVSIALIAYRQQCEEVAKGFREHEELQKAEISHRYFKALKLAGSYAFVEGARTLTLKHLEEGIQLAEDSGKHFTQLLSRDRAYVRLAKFFASSETEVTRADLVESLPYFVGSESARRELIDLAIAYGYPRNIVIKREIRDGIEFFSGETLEETDLNRMIVAYSDHDAYNYRNEFAPYSQLERLFLRSDIHFVNHHVRNGHRLETNCIKGFNMAVIDVDGTCSIDTFRLLMRDYEYTLYTTKRHTAEENRFRVVFPLSHTVKLDAEDFKQFMDNLGDWLPLSSDNQVGQRSRKWLCNSGELVRNEGKLLEATLFIPKTKKSDELTSSITSNSNLTNLERWFFTEAGEGNRNNTIARYAFALLDAGHSEKDIIKTVEAFNKRLKKPLAKDELQNTVLKSVGQRINQRE